MYDDIADYYDLVYQDWEASMRWHGEVLSGLLPAPGARILDVAAGIGTQALPLAARGYEVVARDLSRGAIRRLRAEAASRGLDIDAAPADMRSVATTVQGPFDAIICFDNSLPHLTTDADIVGTLEVLEPLLGAGGQILASVRDYAAVDRTPESVHPYGERQRDGRRFRLGQEWNWEGPDHYRTTMVVEEEDEDGWTTVRRASTRYYAIPVEHLLALFRQAGLRARRVQDSGYFQPVLRGERPGDTGSYPETRQ